MIQDRSECRRFVEESPKNTPDKVTELHRDPHVVACPKCLVAYRAFPHPVLKTLVDAVVAEDVSASLEDRVLKVFPADTTQS